MAMFILAGTLGVLLCLLLLFSVPLRTTALHNNEFGYADTAANTPQLPQDEIDELLEKHNVGRSEVEPTAANMNKVAWSHDLYVAAKDRVETCNYIVDIPKETGHYGRVVQFTGISKKPTFDLSDAVDMWMYLGKDSYSYEEDTCSRDDIFCRMYKLFTWGPMRIIGCAHTLCNELNDTYSDKILENTYYWKCNYFPVGNLEDANPYTVGTPCLQCPDGTGWCNNELDMCDSECNPINSDCECLYSSTCEGVYDYDPEACTCTCDHDTCRDDQFVCILKCGDPSWVVVDNDNGVCYCDCPVGYEANDDQDVCNDIDECAVDPDLCEHYCDNTAGSYVCSCTPGFVLTSDGHGCVPFFVIGRHDFVVVSTTEEATTTEEVTTEVTTEATTAEETTPVETTTECIFYSNCGAGTYDPISCKCICNEGYTFNKGLQTCKSSCQDCCHCGGMDGCYCDDLCIGFGDCCHDYTTYCVGPCESSPCKNGGTCTNDGVSGYLCDCLPGYSGTNCKEFDPCFSSPCVNDATCINDGSSSYSCNCAYGYTGVNCNDINECETEGSECEDCEDLVGDYRCTSCPVGFFLHEATWRCEQDVCNLGEAMHCSNNGFLDEDTCKCVCSSGYKGVICEIPCAVTEKTCWPEYSTVIPTDPSQCVVYCPECECEGYTACDHNGVLARAPGFEFIKNGICRCYCPLPWSGDLCDECNLTCQNGGTLNALNCSCSCTSNWYGLDCTKPCVQKSRLCTTKTLKLCGEVPIIDQQCPVMCGHCSAEK